MANVAGATLPGGFPVGRVVFTVGRWLATERYKGMDTLIMALPRLLLRWPDLQLVLAGSGDDREWLEAIARESGVSRHVHFLTDLSYGQLAACYAAAEVFALPSRGEGFGFVYLEAMARGKPVIGGAHGGAPEVIADGETGYLVQHGDPVQLATSIDALLANPDMAKQMGSRGRERVEQRVSLQCFRQILSKNSARTMRILNVTQTYAPFFEFGGPPAKVKALAEGLAQKGHEVTVLTADWGLEKRLKESPGETPAQGSPFGHKREVNGVRAIYLANWLRYRTTTWNPAAGRYLRARLRDFDVVHIFGLYDLLGPRVASECRKLQDSLYRRTHRNVQANRAQFPVQKNLSPAVR